MSRLKKYIEHLSDQLTNLDKRSRINLILLAGILFLILFTYPMIRAAITSIFLDSNGAKKSPLVWTYSIIALSFFVYLFNHFQRRLKIQRLFGLVVFLSILFFGCTITLVGERPWLSYPLFVWKEVYIILLVHSCLAFLNSKMTKEYAKIFYGPLGAIGSLGGLLGGLVTSTFIKDFGLVGVVWFACLGLFIAAVIFMQTGPGDLITHETKKDRKGESPLTSIKKVRGYVFWVAIVVMCSQFVVNLGNFKFNMALEAFGISRIEKAEFLGTVYAWINGLSLFIQIAIVPFLLTIVREKRVHHLIVFFYAGLLLLSLAFPMALMVPTILFISYKGVDYSLFSTAKEILYFKLNDAQKYGAKYIVDMIVYRASKALISLILILVQGAVAVNLLLAIALILWFFSLRNLFSENPKDQENL